jgi:CheY-like chemotaxis protein
VSAGAGRRVLLVEDTADVRMIVRFVLEDAGLTVDEAVDGTAGLLTARTLPDVVLLDVQLPDLDSPDVLRALRNDPVTQGLAVVFLTAGDRRGDDELQALGAAGVLHKPFDVATFADELAALT